MAEERLFVNFLTRDELLNVQGMGPAVVSAILDFRESQGNINRTALETLMRRPLSEGLALLLDFTPSDFLVQQLSARKSDHGRPGTPGTPGSSTRPGLTTVRQRGDVLTTPRQHLTAPRQQVDQDDVLRAIRRLPTVPTQKSRERDEMTARRLVFTSSERAVHPHEDHGLIKQEVHTPVRSEPETVAWPHSLATRRQLPRLPDDVRPLTPVPDHRQPHQLSERYGLPSDRVEDNEWSLRGASRIPPGRAESMGHVGQPLPDDWMNPPSARPAALQTPSKPPVLKDIPRSMSYDGTSNWKSFEMKFVQYATAFHWTSEDCKTCLLHCLTGKALDYCARILRSNPNMPYRKLLGKMQERFGAELQAEAQVKFNQAVQAGNESMEDWADRVQELAAEAFQGLPESFANKQTIARFCQGLSDMDAGHSAFMKDFDSIEMAIRDIRLYRHSKSDMLQKRNRQTRRAEDYDDAQVYAVNKAEPEASGSLRKELDELKEQMKQMSVKKPFSSRRRGLTQQGGPRQRSGNCFLCNQPGHFVRECPKNQVRQNLNGKGSSRAAEARPEREATE